MQSKSWAPNPLALLFLIGISIAFSSCAPKPGFSAPPQPRRCIMFVSAPWCEPCQRVKRDVFPRLIAKGISISDFADKKRAHIHLADHDRDAAAIAQWKLDDVLPATVVFEGQKIVEIRYGELSEADFYELFERNHMIEGTRTPVKVDQSERIGIDPDPTSTSTPPIDAVGTSQSPAKSTWDQIREFFGGDNVTITLSTPNGRKIVIPDAGAVLHVPATLTANTRIVGDSIIIDFDGEKILAEVKRYGIRASTTIPSIKVDREQVTVKTGLHIPFVWKLEGHPFSAQPFVPTIPIDDDSEPPAAPSILPSP